MNNVLAPAHFSGVDKIQSPLCSTAFNSLSRPVTAENGWHAGFACSKFVKELKDTEENGSLRANDVGTVSCLASSIYRLITKDQEKTPFEVILCNKTHPLASADIPVDRFHLASSFHGFTAAFSPAGTGEVES